QWGGAAGREAEARVKRTDAANNRGNITQFYVWIAVLAFVGALPAQEALSIVERNSNSKITKLKPHSRAGVRRHTARVAEHRRKAAILSEPPAHFRAGLQNGPSVIHPPLSLNHGYAIPFTASSPDARIRRHNGANPGIAHRSRSGSRHKHGHVPFRISSGQSPEARRTIHPPCALRLLRWQRLLSCLCQRSDPGGRSAPERSEDAAQPLGHRRPQYARLRTQRCQTRARHRLHCQHSEQAG